MLAFLPDKVVRVMGADTHKAGITSLFELLQQRKLNKQVGNSLSLPVYTFTVNLVPRISVLPLPLGGREERKKSDPENEFNLLCCIQ